MGRVGYRPGEFGCGSATCTEQSDGDIVALIMKVGSTEQKETKQVKVAEVCVETTVVVDTH